MNVRQQLLRKNSRANANIVLGYVAQTPNGLIEVMGCFLSDEVKVAQRAAQVVGDWGRIQPQSLQPYWAAMLQAAEAPVHDAICRNVSRYFSELELTLPTDLERSLVKLMASWSIDLATPVATTVFSMRFIANRADRYPVEANLVKTQIESRISTGSTGFKNAGKKILKQLEV